MPSKKKKYNARFPAGRIKKIMQTDEEIGKVAQAVPVIISRTLELFVKSLLTKSMQITQARNAKTLTPSHMKQCILSENRFDFLKDLVKSVPDASVQEDNENNAIFEDNSEKTDGDSDGAGAPPETDRAPETYVNRPEVLLPPPVHMPANFYNEQSGPSSRTPVIQYGPRIAQAESAKLNFSVNRLLGMEEPKLHITIASEQLTGPRLDVGRDVVAQPRKMSSGDNAAPLVPIAHSYGQSSGDNLCIDEDYDN